MKTSIRAHALVIAMLTAAALVVPLATPASAAQHAACSKLTAGFTANGKYQTIVSKCTPAALAAGGTSVGSISKTGPTKGQNIATITWKNGKGTTVATLKYAPAKTNGKCKSPTKRTTVTGKVIGGKGAAAKIILKGEPVNISICAFTSGSKIGQASLEPGTKYKM